MCPKEIGKPEMEIATARNHHQTLLGKLMSGPGDGEGAMWKAERLFGLPYWQQWNLRHKRRATDAFMERVRQAYLSMLETSVRRDLERLKTEQAKGQADVDLELLIVEGQSYLAKIEARKMT